VETAEEIPVVAEAVAHTIVVEIKAAMAALDL
jgi:hypothetical protein